MRVVAVRDCPLYKLRAFCNRITGDTLPPISVDSVRVSLVMFPDVGDAIDHPRPGAAVS
jgi:hypothetical protein